MLRLLNQLECKQNDQKIANKSYREKLTRSLCAESAKNKKLSYR